MEQRRIDASDDPERVSDGPGIYRSTSVPSRTEEDQLLERITFDREIFGGKAIIRGRRMSVEQVLGMLAAGDSFDDLFSAYDWLEDADLRACLAYARRIVGAQSVEPGVEPPSEPPRR